MSPILALPSVLVYAEKRDQFIVVRPLFNLAYLHAGLCQRTLKSSAPGRFESLETGVMHYLDQLLRQFPVYRAQCSGVLAPWGPGFQKELENRYLLDNADRIKVVQAPEV